MIDRVSGQAGKLLKLSDSVGLVQIFQYLLMIRSPKVAIALIQGKFIPENYPSKRVLLKIDPYEFTANPSGLMKIDHYNVNPIVHFTIMNAAYIFRRRYYELTIA